VVGIILTLVVERIEKRSSNPRHRKKNGPLKKKEKKKKQQRLKPETSVRNTEMS